MSQKIQVIKGTAFWCMPNTQNRLSGKYEMDLSRLDEQTVKALKSAGVSVQFDNKTPIDSPDNKGAYIKVRSYSPVRVVDMENNEIPPQLKIGNGSIVHAAIKTEEWVHKDSGRSGVRAKWLGLKVQELVEYNPDEANQTKGMSLLEDVSGEGFTFGESAVDDADAATLFGDAE